MLYPPLAEIAALAEHGLGAAVDPTDPGSVVGAARRLGEDPSAGAGCATTSSGGPEELSWEREEA